MADNTTFTEEFEGAEGLAPEQANTEVPADVVKPKAERKLYTLLDGSEGSRNAFIKEQFVVLNKSRKQIADEFGFEYRTVYSATVNMTNEAEASTRGRAAGNATIQVNAENQLVVVQQNEDGSTTTFVNGVATDVAYAEEDLQTVSRNEWIKEQVANGVARGDLAKMLDISYGVIYGLTKEAEGTRTVHMITLEDGTEISRTEYIRQQIAAGKTRGEVAKELGVDYSVVWQATKVQKTAADKFAELVENIKKYRDQVDDAEAFDDAIVTLEALNIVEEAEESNATDAESEDAEQATEE